MADPKDLLEFLEGGIGMVFNVGVQFLRIEFAPVAPAGFGGQCARLGRCQIPVNRLPAQLKAAGGFGFGAPVVNELHHPFP